MANRVDRQTRTRVTFRSGSAGMLLLVGTLSILSGCERRNFYRTQADQEVNCIVQQTSQDPRYALPGVNIYMDSRSRYFDPYDPNRPPMPSDDPASNRFMRCVDGMRGYECWECDGVIDNLQNPGWQDRLPEYVPVNDDGTVLLSVDSALNLAYVNSTDYQDALEEIYLSALDVSAERFQFQTQFFGGNDNNLALSGVGRNDPSGAFPLGTTVNGFSEYDTSTNASIDRQFATAGTLAVDFANSFVWQFSGADTSSAISFASFSFIQPLLRNGGRIIALETLTIAERTMLANLRTFQRYRQGFYTNVAIGSSTASPNRRGGFAGGTGLTGFVGQGSGGFGGVGGATGFGRGGGVGGAAGGGGGGAGGLAGGGAGNVGGFIGLLQARQEYLNDVANYRLQQRTFEELQANFDAGLIDSTQVDQFRQTLQTQQSTLTQGLFSLETQIQNYLTGTLSLPPDIPVELDDSFIRPFQLITPEMTELQDRVNRVQDVLGVDQPLSAEQLTEIAHEIQSLYQDFADYLSVIDEDETAMQAAVQQRIQSMSESDKQQFIAEIELQIEQYNESKRQMQTFQERLTNITNSINSETTVEMRDALTTWRRDFAVWAQALALVHARFRLESITLNTVDLDLPTALDITWANRVDLMNNRADLVNTWRLIAFNANRLMSDVTIAVDGNISTEGDNPLNFSQDNSNLNASLLFDAPFTRLLERNNYRSALISYQRDRRQFIQYEDQLKFSIWQLLEQLKVSEENLELQRQAVVIAIRRVDNTQMDLNAPPQRDATTGQVQPRGPTVVQNLLSALNDLRNTQNNFMSVWLNYYATRMLLMRELGIMELDEQGRWMDMPVDWSMYLPTETIQQVPPSVPTEWMENAFPEGMPQEELNVEPIPDPVQGEGFDLNIPMNLNPPAENGNSASRGLKPLRTMNEQRVEQQRNLAQQQAATRTASGGPPVLQPPNGAVAPGTYRDTQLAEQPQRYPIDRR